MKTFTVQMIVNYTCETENEGLVLEQAIKALPSTFEYISTEFLIADEETQNYN